MTKQEIVLTDGYIHKDDKATSSDALDNSSTNQHLHIDGQRSDQRAHKENSISDQDTWLSPEDI